VPGGHDVVLEEARLLGEADPHYPRLGGERPKDAAGGPEQSDSFSRGMLWPQPEGSRSLSCEAPRSRLGPASLADHAAQ